LILGTDQKPVAGVVVVISARPGKDGAFAPFQSSAVTGTDGMFTLTGVPDGTYAACPHPPSADVLPPCSWATEPRLTIANAGLEYFAAIQFQGSVDLYLRVNDPNGKKAAAGKTPGSNLLVTVRGPNGRMLPIPVTARDNGGYDHHLSVPGDVDLVFTAQSDAFDLADSNGKAIGKQSGSVVTVHIPPGQKQHKEIINIQ